MLQPACYIYNMFYNLFIICRLKSLILWCFKDSNSVMFCQTFDGLQFNKGAYAILSWLNSYIRNFRVRKWKVGHICLSFFKKKKKPMVLNHIRGAVVFQHWNSCGNDWDLVIHALWYFCGSLKFVGPHFEDHLP